MFTTINISAYVQHILKIGTHNVHVATFESYRLAKFHVSVT